MDVAIIGGGIGGLTAALSLHAAKIPVTVYEAAAEVRPLGVGINLLPHAVRELTELGLGEQLAETGIATKELIYANRHGQFIWQEPRGRDVGYNWPQYSIHRGKLQIKDRDWALLDYADNPQGGWSSIGNPGTLINPAFIPIASSIGQPPVIFGDVDPNCNALGGFNTPIASTGGGICRFQYTFFDNLIEETDQYKLFGEVNYELTPTTNFSIEAAWSKLEIPEWNTSPV